MKNKICFRCKKEINEEDNYFAMVEMNHKKEVKTDYVHKVCWDVFYNQLNGASSSLAKSNYLLNVLGNHMKKVGIIPEQKQEVEIC